MRVITGTARGRRLLTVPGKDSRPTTARVKEAIFSVIQFDMEGRRVLDLFAGTGQMGIEALSRGAAGAVFVDNCPKALAVIRRNLDHLGLAGQSQIVSGDALTFVRRRPAPFDIIFLDPPYHGKLLFDALDCVSLVDILHPGGIIICETTFDVLPPELPPPYRREKIYRYGVPTVCFYRREPW